MIDQTPIWFLSLGIVFAELLLVFHRSSQFQDIAKISK
jgi:hypothetical protein